MTSALALVIAVVIAIAFAVAAVAVALSAVFGQAARKRICTCVVENGFIRVVLYSRITAYRIPLSEVDAVERFWPSQARFRLFYGLRLGNSNWANAVIIRKKGGLMRQVMLTPDDPMAFIDQCRAARSEWTPEA
jgi:hypothetical protein